MGGIFSPMEGPEATFEEQDCAPRCELLMNRGRARTARACRVQAEFVIARSHRAFIGTPVFRRAMATKQSRSRQAPCAPLDRVAVARAEGRASLDALSLAMTAKFAV